jgi:hypothetical protein
MLGYKQLRTQLVIFLFSEYGPRETMTISDMVSYLGNTSVFRVPRSEDNYVTRI